jgi:peptidoglycan-associated lipoprotein
LYTLQATSFEECDVMTRLRRLVLILSVACVLAAVAAGCHKKVPPTAPAAPPPPPPTAPVTPPRPVQPPPPPEPVLAPRPLNDDEIFARKSLDELTRELTDVHFDLDRAEVRDDARAGLQKDADWLKRWTSTQVTIEGHCDPRGSAEYNLALGSRRASAVKDYLVNLGVPANRVTVVSKGKEQPLCSEESESCWQQNRRGHFIVTAK